jgi:hypothetical protein
MAIAAKIDMAFMAAGGTLLVPSATSNFQVVGVSLVPTMAPTLIATTTAAAGAATTAGEVRRVRATHYTSTYNISMHRAAAHGIAAQLSGGIARAAAMWPETLHCSANHRHH